MPSNIWERKAAFFLRAARTTTTPMAEAMKAAAKARKRLVNMALRPLELAEKSAA